MSTCPIVLFLPDSGTVSRLSAILWRLGVGALVSYCWRIEEISSDSAIDAVLVLPLLDFFWYLLLRI
jgi:hypothetical protein